MKTLLGSEFLGPRKKKSEISDTLLKGDLLPKSVTSVTLVVRAVRKPEWKSVVSGKKDAHYALDFKFSPMTVKKLKGSKAENCVSWAVNNSNASRLREYLSEADDFNELIGSYIVLRKKDGWNPTEKKECKTFEVFAVRMPESDDFVEYPPVPAAEEEEEETDFDLEDYRA